MAVSTALVDTNGVKWIDGCHPNDIGMRRMANAFGQAVKTALIANGNLRQ